MFAIDFKYLGTKFYTNEEFYKKKIFICTNLQSREEAKKSATELLAVIVGHEIFTDESECVPLLWQITLCAKRYNSKTVS